MKKLILYIFLFFVFVGLQGQSIIPGIVSSQGAAGCTSLQLLSGTSQGSDINSNLTDHPIVMPTGTQPGNLILVFFTCEDGETISINTGVSGSNWTIETQVQNGANVTAAAIWKVAEGGDALTITTSSAERGSFIAYRLCGFETSNPLTVTSATGASTNADPPSNTGEYGADDYLWFAIAGIKGQIVASATPSDFIELLTQQDPFVGGASLSAAYRFYNIDAAYNPSAFTSAIGFWIAFNCIVNPDQ